MATMQAIMRYNNFQHDPLSECAGTPGYSAENGIAARDDLNDANGAAAVRGALCSSAVFVYLFI